jgi:hypothetical protein
MPKRRAQITRQTAGEMYGDVIDRVTAQAERRATLPPPEPEEPERPFLVKATVYLTVEDVLAIDRICSDEFRITGKKPRRSTVVSRAIQLLLAQHEAGEVAGSR